MSARLLSAPSSGTGRSALSPASAPFCVVRLGALSSELLSSLAFVAPLLAVSFLPPLAKDLSLGWFVQIAGRMQHDLKKKVGVFCLIPWFWRLEILVLLFDFFVSGCVLAVIL